MIVELELHLVVVQENWFSHSLLLLRAHLEDFVESNSEFPVTLYLFLELVCQDRRSMSNDNLSSLRSQVRTLLHSSTSIEPKLRGKSSFECRLRLGVEDLRGSRWCLLFIFGLSVNRAKSHIRPLGLLPVGSEVKSC